METKSRYTGLYIVSWVLIILAWIVLGLAILAAIGLFIATRGQQAGLFYNGLNIAGVMVGLMGLWWFFLLLIVGSLLALFRDVERNTRATAEAVARLVQMSQAIERSAPPSPAPPVQTRPVPPAIPATITTTQPVAPTLTKPLIPPGPTATPTTSVSTPPTSTDTPTQTTPPAGSSSTTSG